MTGVTKMDGVTNGWSNQSKEKLQLVGKQR